MIMNYLDTSRCQLALSVCSNPFFMFLIAISSLNVSEYRMLKRYLPNSSFLYLSIWSPTTL